MIDPKLAEIITQALDEAAQVADNKYEATAIRAIKESFVTRIAMLNDAAKIVGETPTFPKPVIINIDVVELTVRLIETVTGSTRPVDNAFESLKQLDMPRELQMRFYDAAEVATEFVIDSLTAQGLPINAFPSENESMN